MARITVEDCLEHIDNQFDLVLLAAKRARRIANGADPLVEAENDKPTVIALREIAEGLINEEILENMAQPEEDILSSEQAEELLANTPLPSIDAIAEAVVTATPVQSFSEAASEPVQSFSEAASETEPGAPLPGFQEVSAEEVSPPEASAPAEAPVPDPLADLDNGDALQNDSVRGEPKPDSDI